MLTDSQRHSFDKNGYVVFDQLFSIDSMHELQKEAMRIVDEFDPTSTRAIFTTKLAEANTNKYSNTNAAGSADFNRDDYFLSSGDKIRCFFEEEAFDQSGELQQEKALSINKIGHALHVHSAVFKAFSCASIIANIAKGLGCVKPQIHQSMYIFKQPRIGGDIRWHQDATYFFTQPQSVLTFWLAVQDATIQNGCLQVQKDGASFPIKEQFKRYENDDTELVNLLDIPWPDTSQALPLEVQAGSLVVFNGALPHFSKANRSAFSRHAFTLHITSADTQYDKHNWLQAEPMPLG